MPTQLPDIDPDETREWVESLDAVLDERGKARARYLMLKLIERARERQVGVPALRSTDYINSIPPEREPWFPGDEHVERRIRAFIRWNAAVMVSKANRKGLEVGGHIATYQSAASLYEVGFNHFFRGKDHPGGGDQIFIQGHASPGMYARAFLEGRLSADQLDGFRQEVSRGPHNGLSSYPHPRLMPDFWEFPTVSMGLAALNSIYQARFNRYLHHRGIKDTSQQHVWAFLGDGEMGEPESLGAIGLAAREELDNLTFVINCNLQQLDGPVRGNGKVIQELEAFLPRRRLERDQGDLGPGVGRAAGAGPRRRAGEQDEHHAGRPVPDLLGRVRRVHPEQLLRRRPAAPADGQQPVRRGPAQAAARRSRLPQGVRRVQERD
jgi:pyruvate dehydrogenase E1 component